MIIGRTELTDAKNTAAETIEVEAVLGAAHVLAATERSQVLKGLLHLVIAGNVTFLLILTSRLALGHLLLFERSLNRYKKKK